MTAYQGGKQQLGRKIYNEMILLEKKLSNKPLPYFEPFCGMCGVLVHFARDKDTKRKLSGCDINQDILYMWKALQRGWKPPLTCTKQRYEELKYTKRHSAERGFLGVVCSFGGQFFRGNFRTTTKTHNFITAGARGVTKASKDMLNVEFKNSTSYDNFNPEGYLIYCDPPYVGNKVSNDTFQNFNHEKFWDIMREWSKKNIVVISEIKAPDDFISIWSKEYKVSFLSQTKNNKNIKKQYTEKLFVHKNTYKTY
jgi:site-specific DNA-adenine methylase